MILSRILKEHEYWLRLSALIIYFSDSLYHNILHNSCKLPTKPDKLYTVFNKKRNHIKTLLKRQKLTPEQFNLIYPTSKRPDIRKFDIGTFLFVVRHFTRLKPSGGWVLVNKLKRGDKSKAALLLDLEHYIKENLESIEPIMAHRFEDDWDDLIYILKGLKVNVMEVQGLKTCPISRNEIPSKYEEAIMKAQLEFVQNIQKLNAISIRNLQVDDEENENFVDITNLTNQNKKTEEMVDFLGDLLEQMGTSLHIFHTKLKEADELLMELKDDIEFLKQVMSLDREPLANYIDYTDNSSEEPDYKLKMRLGIRKLKASHAFSLNKDENANHGEGMQQTYIKVELLCQRQVIKSLTSSSFDYGWSADNVTEEHIELEDLFKFHNNVILRGISGIGKSYIAREIMSRWIHGSIFNNIKFLFIVNYHDAGNKTHLSLEEILKHLYPHVFEVVSINDIISKPNQVLVIFDGWDQTDSLDYAHAGTYDLICDQIATDGGILRGQNSIIATRPSSFAVLLKHLQNADITVVDILGFNDAGIHNFILDFFSSQKKIFKIIKRKFEDNETLKQLMKIPANLSNFCFIHMHDSTTDEIKISTELYLHKLAVLLKECNESGAKSNLFEDSVVLTSIIEAAQMSYQDQMGWEDMTGSLSGHSIQYLLTSIHLYRLNISPLDIKQDFRLHDCLSFVSGLHGAAAGSELSLSGPTYSFVRNLDALHNRDFISQLFLAYLQPSKKQEEYTFGAEFLEFLVSYFEFQGFLVQNEEFREIKINFVLHNLLPRDVSNLIHFFDHEWYQLDIRFIDLHTHQPITQQQMEGLAYHLLRIPVVKIDIKTFEDISPVFTKLLQKSHSTEFIEKIRELHLTQACIYQTKSNINFDWLIYLNRFHLNLQTVEIPDLINELQNVIPKALKENLTINLLHLKVTFPSSSGALLSTLITLINNLTDLKEVEIVVVEKRKTEYYEPYRNHIRYGSDTEVTDVSAIKYALYKALHDNVIPRNLHRLKVTDRFSNYEFIINNNTNQITVILDNQEEAYVDVELLAF